MITLVATVALLAAAQQANAVAAVPAASELQGLHDFGACLARDRSKAGALLAAVPGTAHEGEVLVSLVKKGCPDINEFTLEPALLRGIVAEAMFERDFGTFDAPGRRPAVAVFAAPSGDQLTSLPRATQRTVGMIAYARCVVEQAPQQTMAVFRSAPGSADEGAAFSALGSTLGPCLPEGMKVEFTRPQLRGALAEAAYRAAASK